MIQGTYDEGFSAGTATIQGSARQIRNFTLEVVLQTIRECAERGDMVSAATVIDSVRKLRLAEVGPTDLQVRMERAEQALSEAGYVAYSNGNWQAPVGDLAAAKEGMRVARECLMDFIETSERYPTAMIRRRVHIVQQGVEALNKAMQAVMQNKPKQKFLPVFDGLPNYEFPRAPMPGVNIDWVHKSHASKNSGQK